MKLGDVHGNTLSACVIPGAHSNAIARVDGARSLSAEVRVPGCRAPASGSGQGLAIRVSAGQSAIIGAVTLAHARNEETHWLRRRLSAALSAATTGLVLGDQDNGSQKEHRRSNSNS